MRKEVWLVAAAVILGTIVIVAAVFDEPYHIDELLQVSSYSRHLHRTSYTSLVQQQPPLDPLLNALFERVVGQGDARQRALSAAFGVGSLILMGLLCLRAGLGHMAFLPVLVLAVSPTFAEYTAYARPYALPMFLMLAFAASTDVWLRDQKRTAAALSVASGLALPFSRALEPPIFLAAAILILVPKARSEWARWARSRSAIPIGTAAAGILLVSLPFAVIARHQLSRYAAEGFIQFRGLGRFATELAPILGQSIPCWPVALAALAFVLARKGPGRDPTAPWWWWALFACPLGFATLFFLSTPADQPYYPRYSFFFLPPLAFVIGLAGRRAGDLWASGGRILPVAAGVAIAVFLVSSGTDLAHNLTTTTRADWAAAARAIEQMTSADTVVLFDHVRPLGAYRTRFAGAQRYLSPTRKVRSVADLKADSEDPLQHQQVAVMLLGARPYVPGWRQHQIDAYFTLYLPAHTYRWPAGAANACLAFASRLEGTSGDALRIAAIVIMARANEFDKADEMEKELLDSADPADREAILRELDRVKAQSSSR
ncbi:MAG: hypothetical protein PHU25_02630 [Deltaproteobacteria bacterium]|nr:hypothetical protein [Deltaproteobacteria bacterium]